MSLVVADGSLLSIASTYGTSVAMSAITNATEAVATLGAGHSVVVGDFLQINSAWPDLDGKILRAKTVVTNDITLEGFNTVDVAKFPPGGGVGTVLRISAWTNIGQILSIGKEGGGQNYYDYQFMNELQSRRIPTTKEPLVLAFKMADDIALAQQGILRAAENSGIPMAVRLIFRNGSRTVANGYWTMSYLPDLALGQANQRDVSVALSCLPQEYAT